MEGLTYVERQGEAGAFEHLKFLLSSSLTSFPVIAVPLEALKDYDGRVQIRLKPNQYFDHALVLLGMDERDAQFFDPTFNPVSAGLVRETMSTPRLLEWWRRDPEQPYYRGWVEALPPRSTPTGGGASRLSTKDLYTFASTSEAGGGRRHRKQ